MLQNKEFFTVPDFDRTNKEAKNGAFPSSLSTTETMAFPEHSVPGNYSPSADKTFTDRWGIFGRRVPAWIWD